MVVGIGASAGGVQALQEFFQHVPPDSGMAYVVILHLSPNHDSQLAEVLQRATAMPVAQVTDKTRIKPNHVYVVPPDKHLIMEEHHITVAANTLVEERRAPVDIFFRSLADTHFANAVGVVLSGTGANGSMGIKRIKERGGLAFVQNPREAQFAEMPRNSIATDLIDDVLPVAQIPDKIIAYRNSLGKVEIPIDAEVRAEEQQYALREIFTLLRSRTGHDFANYKRATLMRRIERRINVRAMPTIAAYAEFMRDNPDETNALLKDLLISVTNFFRDKEPFEYIAQTVLPALLQGKRAEDQLRIWVVGCATGEEAYSLAMLCAELTEGVLEAPKLQIFATDIDEAAIGVGRNGVYTLSDVADVSPERLRRYFNREGEQYRIRREIREMVLFAKHNVLKDPPFSRIDLVTCRNMLIYLNGIAQERVMETLHFALEPGGYLFLGTSESADSASDLFTLQSRDNHVYRARHVQPRQYPVPDSTPDYYKPQRLQNEQPHQPSKPSGRFQYADLHLQLLEHYAPPSVVINADYDIMHISERAGRYMQVVGGEPSQNLLKLIRPELRLDLRTAQIQAVQKQANVDAMGLPVRIDDHTEAVNILVRPVVQGDNAGKDFILVLFEPALPPGEGGETHLYVSDQPAAQQLEEELIRVKSQLRATIEQHEFGTEELKASNEELQAMNEEIRSSAEELETSKEELQSINEELSTANQELKVKIEELSISTNNLQNLINSTNIGTIFLDRSFRVALFTPRARDVFNLIPADIGRPISDITSRLEDSTIHTDADEVLLKLITTEREVRTTDGIVYLMRISPYRTEDDRINGVVISFIDITGRKKSEEALRTSEERLRIFISASSDAVYSMNADWSEMHPFTTRNFMVNTDIPSKSWADTYIHPEDQRQVREAIQEAIREQRMFELEHRVLRTDGTLAWMHSRAIPLLDNSGRLSGWFGTARDVTERKEAEEKLAAAHARTTEILDSIGDVFYTLDSGYRYTYANRRGEEMWGKKCEEVLGKTIWEAFPEIKDSESERMHQQVMESREAVHYEAVSPIIKRWISVGIYPASDGGLSVYFRDIEDRKSAEEALRASEERARTLADAIPHIIWTNAVDGTANYFNQRWFEYTGLSFEESVGPGWEAVVHPDDAPTSIERWKTAFAKDEVFDTEYRLRRHDGAYRWFIGRNVPLRNDSGRVLGWFGSATDIHDLKEAEEAVRASEGRLRVTMDSAIDYSIMTLNTEGKYTGWSTGAERTFGYTEAEAIGQPSSLIFTPEDIARGGPEEEMQTAVRNGYAPDERWHIRSNDERFYMSGVMRPILNPKLAGFVKVARDITEQKRAEEAVRITEERYRIALQSAEMAAWDWNVEADHIAWNEQHYTMLGIKEEVADIDQDFFLSFVHPEDVEGLRAALKEAIEETGMYRAAFRIIRRDNGETRWMNGFGRAITREGKRALRIVGVMYDITQQKALEQQKDEFIGIASHELRTPVSSLKAYTEVLQEMFEETGDAQHAGLMKKMDLQVDRLTELIRALLDVTKLTEGRLQFRRETFNLNDLVLDTRDEMQRTTRHELQFVQQPLRRVPGDPQRVRQVLFNLISNAIKYSPDTERILISTRQEDNEAIVCVQDFGIGMGKEVQSHVFDRFYRSDEAGVNTYPGLGLGLYISAEFVRRHSGRIWVEQSEIGKGSTFCFSLPTE